MKKAPLYLATLLLLFFCITLHGTTVDHYERTESGICCARRLLPHLRAIEQTAAGKNLLKKVLSKGEIVVSVMENEITDQFCACWNQETRTILIGLSRAPSRGEIIASLLFELHNAVNSSRFDLLDDLATAGRINKKHYVEAMELIEYANSLSAAEIASQGMRQGLFPKDTCLYIYPNFTSYLQAQQEGKHSAVFERNYDMMRSCRRDLRHDNCTSYGVP